MDIEVREAAPGRCGPSDRGSRGRGCSTVANISAATRAGTDCDSCAEELQELIEAHFAVAPG
ncbi:hypothetical protein ART_4069 [Arthrobacter sp. PAMC 25486]|nr:hypothetical protein ART_4069 [Arthrobacter sp. PAMC 25486]